MDGEWFDALARELSRLRSRRGALGVLGGLAVRLTGSLRYWTRKAATRRGPSRTDGVRTALRVLAVMTVLVYWPGMELFRTS
jgi:hypothetical protein